MLSSMMHLMIDIPMRTWNFVELNPVPLIIG